MFTRTTLHATAAIILSTLLASPAAAMKLYNLDEYTTPGGRTVSGIIATDGTLGSLSDGNLLPGHSRITISGPDGFVDAIPAFLSISNQGVGGSLDATSTELWVSTPGILQAAFDNSLGAAINPNCDPINCSLSLEWNTVSELGGYFAYFFLDFDDFDPFIDDLTAPGASPLRIATVPVPPAMALFALGVMPLLRRRAPGRDTAQQHTALA